MRFPLLPTLLVAAAVVAMIGLGIWQLRRADEKEALQARYSRNAGLPPIARHAVAVADRALLFRRAPAFCLEVTQWRVTGGQSAGGRGGTRFIAACRTRAEVPARA